MAQGPAGRALGPALWAKETRGAGRPAMDGGKKATRANRNCVSRVTRGR